jgi:hypothetical protein
MHLELVVPALFPAPPGASLPALELLLARGRRSECEPAGLEAWLADRFGIREKALPAGALSALAFGLDPGVHFWIRADPVHLRAERDRLVLFPSASFALEAAEAEQLGAALAGHFSDRFALKVLRPDLWVVQTETEADLRTKPPLELAGSSADANLPDKRWHALLNEMQMALHQHPVNAAREERGEPLVNSVWLWGGGRLPAAARSAWQSLSAHDPVALGLAKLSGARQAAPGAGAREWLDRAPGEGRHLVVLEGLRAPRALGDAAALAEALRALEERWFAPLLEALRAGRVGMITLHAPEAGRAFETIRGDLRRFWRRRRPLRDYGRDL